MSTPFSELPKTFQEQMNLLESRGMHIRDRKYAESYLQHFNYYRLRAYWIPFIDRTTGNNNFQEGTEFQDVLDLYLFDRKLRLLVLDAIERIEVSVRSQLAYQLAHCHGAHAHLDQSFFKRKFWQSNLDDLKREVERSQETFILDFQQTYSEDLPPIWVVCEVMSFGLLSKWFKSIRRNATKTKIAKTYDLKSNLLGSWLHHLSNVRNLCAHHSRLWNREFVVTLRWENRDLRPSLAKNFVSSSNKIYNTLVILLYLMDQISPDHYWGQDQPNHEWGRELRHFLQSCPQPLSAMGFPNDWQNRTIWQR